MNRNRIVEFLYWFIVVLMIVLGIIQLRQYLNLWTYHRVSAPSTNQVNMIGAIDEETGILRPERIYGISGMQDGRICQIGKETAYYEEIYASAWAWMKEILHGDTSSRVIAIAELGDHVQCRFEYGTTLPAQTVQDKTNWSVSYDFSFDEIWLIPSDKTDEMAKICLIDSEHAQAIEIVSLLYGWMDENDQNMIRVIREACEQLGEHYLIREEFFPEMTIEKKYLRDQTVSDSFMYWNVESRRFADMDAGQEYASRFFEWPELITSQSYQEGIWIYTDDQISLRVTEDGQIDYVKTSLSQKNNMSLSQAYDIAYTFLRDTAFEREMNMGIVLKEWEQSEAGIRFRWDYTIQDIPYVPEKESYVEIEIRGGEVCRFHQDLLNCHVNLYRTRIMDDSELKVLNRLGLRNVDEIELICRPQDGQLELYWYLRRNHQVRYESVRLNGGGV